MEDIKTTIFKNKTYIYIAVGFIIGFSFLMNVLFTIQLKLENRNLENEISELENRIKGAQQELQQAKTDANIEKLATQRLGMVKSGDTPVKIIVNEEPQKSLEKEKEIERQDKIRIYLRDWYDQMKTWVSA